MFIILYFYISDLNNKIQILQYILDYYYQISPPNCRRFYRALATRRHWQTRFQYGRRLSASSPSERNRSICPRYRRTYVTFRFLVNRFVTLRHVDFFRTIDENRYFSPASCHKTIEMSNIPTGEIIDFVILFDLIEELFMV